MLGWNGAGGFKFKQTLQNPPPTMLEGEITKLTTWALKLAQSLPRVVVTEVRRSRRNQVARLLLALPCLSDAVLMFRLASFVTVLFNPLIPLVTIMVQFHWFSD